MTFHLLALPSLNPGAVRALVREASWCFWTGWSLFWGSLGCMETARAGLSKKPRVYQLSRVKALPLLHLKSWRPRRAFPPKTFLSTSPKHLPPLEKHPCFVPKLCCYSLNLRAKTRSPTFKPMRCIFKWLYWTKKKKTTAENPVIWWYLMALNSQLFPLQAICSAFLIIPWLPGSSPGLSKAICKLNIFSSDFNILLRVTIQGFT